jgi:hypothetical protein
MTMVAARQQFDAMLPLENGDRLSCQEYECRYEAMPHLKKAELIEGVVYMATTLRYRTYGQPKHAMMACLAIYCVGTPIVVVDNTTVRLYLNNESRSDALLRIFLNNISKTLRIFLLNGPVRV